MNKAKSVAILGGGPVGLAAAAHTLERGLIPFVLEAGPSVGHAVRQWGHVKMFSPWEYNVDKAAERLLRAKGWNAPDPEHYPTGAELVDNYLTPLAMRTGLKHGIYTSARVTAISRTGFDKVKTKGREDAHFEIRYQKGAGQKILRTNAVIDATGTWFSPNTAGENGLAAIGEAEVTDHVAYGMPDVFGHARSRYAGKTVAVIGAGHSAIGTLIELVRLHEEVPATKVIWLMRGNKPEKAYGGGANDKLAARGELGATFARLVQEGRIEVMTEFGISHLSKQDDRLRIGAGSPCSGRHVVVDELVVATGFRPDHAILRELRTSFDPALECPPLLAPLIDPNEHSCGTVRPHGARELAQPEPRLYIAGMKSYGRAPTFLMITGYEQVRSIAAEIAGDHEAAERVELILPETGVCSRTPVADAEACCGRPASPGPSAACAVGETPRAERQATCKAGTSKTAETETSSCCG